MAAWGRRMSLVNHYTHLYVHVLITVVSDLIPKEDTNIGLPSSVVESLHDLSTTCTCTCSRVTPTQTLIPCTYKCTGAWWGKGSWSENQTIKQQNVDWQQTFGRARKLLSLQYYICTWCTCIRAGMCTCTCSFHWFGRLRLIESCTHRP